MTKLSKFFVVDCRGCGGPCMAISYTGDFRIHHPTCLECYRKLPEDNKTPNSFDLALPEELSQEKAHEIQNNIDIAIDSLNGSYPDTIQKLQDVRDEIPCHCGNEYNRDGSRRKRRR